MAPTFLCLIHDHQLTCVADGLCYLHRHDVVHGDLKGVRSYLLRFDTRIFTLYNDVHQDNIMIDMYYEPKIADFGLSKLLDEVTSTLTLTQNQFGSVRWSAPELILQPGATLESDVWAFGMTILVSEVVFFHSFSPSHHWINDANPRL